MAIGAAALFARTPAIQARLVKLDPPSTNVLLALNGSMVFAGQGLGAVVEGFTEYEFGVNALGFAAATLALIGASFCTARGAKQHH